MRKAVRRACRLALDAADVIKNENLVDPEDGEDEDFRRMIDECLAVAKAR